MLLFSIICKIIINKGKTEKLSVLLSMKYIQCSKFKNFLVLLLSDIHVEEQSSWLCENIKYVYYCKACVIL
jgi:hypothetical protein